MKDFYYILGVDANCSSIEIKEAYRKLSKKFHPDLNQNDKYFEGRFREIHEAYIILNDPTQRAIYDRNLKKFKTPPSSSGGSSSQQQQQRTHKPPPGTYYQARPAASSSYKINPRRSIDVLFTVILIGITLVFGDYVYKALNAPVKSKPYIAPVVSTVASVVPVKHHHHKHLYKTTPVTEATKVSPAIVTIKQSPQPVQVAAPVIVSAPIPVKALSSPPAPVQNYLYKSTIHANLTGIVNMRETAKFGSAVVKKIPGDSEVEVLEKGGAYYKVRFDGVEGFVPKWAVMVK
jgi:hypothetical protein